MLNFYRGNCQRWKSTPFFKRNEFVRTVQTELSKRRMMPTQMSADPAKEEQAQSKITRKQNVTK